MIVKIVRSGAGFVCRVKRTEKNERMKRSGQHGFPSTPVKQLFHNIAKVLNRRGYDLLKKDPAKEGNLTSADCYLRTRAKPRAGAPHIYIFDPLYAVREAGEEFNRFQEVELEVALDIYGKQPDCAALIEKVESDLYLPTAEPTYPVEYPVGQRTWEACYG